MNWTITFFINSALFGVGLAMDAFSVSMANGLKEPKMKPGRMCLIAGVFCGFQILMPLIGWFCVHTAAEAFENFDKFIPWIALVLLSIIGGNMLKDGIKECKAEKGETTESAESEVSGLAKCVGAKVGAEVISSEAPKLGMMMLLGQGVATAIDALSVGFTIAHLNWIMALTEALIIGAVTFVICMCGLHIGKKVGDRLSGKAGILGGVILIGIGLEIFISNMF